MSRYNHFFEQTGCGSSFREFRVPEDGLSARIDFFDHIMRVAFVKDDVPLMPTYTVCPDGVCPREGRDKLSATGFETEAVEVSADARKIHFSASYAEVDIELLELSDFATLCATELIVIEVNKYTKECVLFVGVFSLKRTISLLVGKLLNCMDLTNVQSLSKV